MASEDPNIPMADDVATTLTKTTTALVGSVLTALSAHEARTQWLASNYLSGDHADFTVRDFSVLKSGFHPVDSYWRDSHIDWALELLRRKYAHSDVTIINTALSSTLFAITEHAGFLPQLHEAEYITSWLPNVNLLKSKPIVVVPVNDGYLQTYGDQATQATKPTEPKLTESSQTQDPTQNNKPIRPKFQMPASGGRGTHWSFLVIEMRDSNNITARYIDGMVRVTRNPNGRLKIRDINFNAQVAGRIICGFETLLQLPAGSIQTSTLKFVPHMRQNDHYNGADNGRCGPHLYAFLSHLLTNKATLMDPGLEATFNDETTRTARKNEFRFNSRQLRATFADELLRERRAQEERSPELAPDNLTPERLKAILTTDVLIALANLCKERDITSPGRNSRRKGGNPPGGDDDSGGGDDDTQDKDSDDKNTRELRKQWRQQLQGGNPFQIKSFEDFLNMSAAHQSLNNPRGHKDTTSSRNDEVGSFLSANKVTAKESKIDFGTISTAKLERSLTEAIMNHSGIGTTPNEYTYRALLFVQHGKSFRNESNKRLQTIWLRDTNVFTENKDFQIREDGSVAVADSLHENAIRNRLYVAYEISVDAISSLSDPPISAPSSGGTEKSGRLLKKKPAARGRPKKQSTNGEFSASTSNTVPLIVHPDTPASAEQHPITVLNVNFSKLRPDIRNTPPQLDGHADDPPTPITGKVIASAKRKRSRETVVLPSKKLCSSSAPLFAKASPRPF
jgi:hypothetical protein